jgi:hypothetical protein
VRDSLRNRAKSAVALIDDAGKIRDHDEYDQGLEKMMTEGRREAVTFLVAVDLTIRLLRLQQVAAVERALGQAPSLRQTALGEIAEIREDFQTLGPLFERWLVSDVAIVEHESGVKVHNRLTTPRRLVQLRDYQIVTWDLRRVLSHSPEDLLPSLPGNGSSYVIDCHLADDDEVYARVAEIEAPAP